MVKGVDGNENVIKLKGQNQSIDTSRLEGLKKTKKNEPIFNKFDGNSDGTLDKTEADNMQAWLKQAAGNEKLSSREMKKATDGNESAFEALVNLTQQQADLAEKGEYIETNSNITTHVVKKENQITRFDSTVDENDNVVEIYEDESKKVIYDDGSYDVTDKDGTITKFDKEGNKTTVIKGDLTTTFEDGKSKTVNKDGKVVEETETQDGKEVKTTYEYPEGKTIKRQSTDGNLDFITVSEQKDGHTYDTKFNTEEDMKNNKPSEVVKDAQNETQKTVSTYEYLDDGNVKITTTDSSGKQTVEYQNDKGEKIDNPNPEKTYTVLKGESISTIVRKNLKEQGIENPTKEQLQKAREAFLELNKDLVKTYNGAKTEWKGNKYFYVGDVVKIPDFTNLGATTKPDGKPQAESPKPQTEPQKPAPLRYTEVNTADINYKRPAGYYPIDPNQEIEIEGSYAVPPQKEVTVTVKVKANATDAEIREALAAKIKETDITRE